MNVILFNVKDRIKEITSIWFGYFMDMTGLR